LADRSNRQLLRATFEEVAELYDRARPQYPASLFDDLVALCGLAGGGRVLEIGCGTGQATLPLARRGLEIVCVELGERLAALARAKLAPFPAVEVVNSSFETWEPADAGFDAVVAFTALHWIEPEVRYEKAARLLGEDGSLAVVMTNTVMPDDGDSFWAEVQEDYDAVIPSDESRPPPHPDEVEDLSSELGESGYFRNVAARRYRWDVSYTADAYIAWLDTTSGHRSIRTDAREQLYALIHRRIETRPGREVRRSYLATLNVARPRR
jgi:SAM-dependent methyltransferase